MSTGTEVSAVNRDSTPEPISKFKIGSLGHEGPWLTATAVRTQPRRGSWLADIERVAATRSLVPG